jgi:hypothetical protein
MARSGELRWTVVDRRGPAKPPENRKVAAFATYVPDRAGFDGHPRGASRGLLCQIRAETRRCIGYGAGQDMFVSGL